MDTLITIATDFWHVLSDMAPYLLLGFAMAGLLSAWIRPELIERHLGGGGFGSVVKAAAFGVPLPLCSCGVIPVGSSLRRHGASRGATTAFLISTPQTGVDSIFVTYSLLGGLYAVFRPIAALVSGLVGGWLVDTLDGENPGESSAPACEDACCSPTAAPRGKLRQAMSYGFVTLPRDIGRALLLGLALAALISALVPPAFFSSAFGGALRGGVLGMLAMMLLGIPVYVCATASVPLAWALIAKGVSPGVALVFLMTGPATNAATIATIAKVMGRKTAVLYLLTVAATALASGLALDAAFRAAEIAPNPGGTWMLPVWFTWTCAVVLLGVLAGAVWPRRGGAHAREHAGDEEHEPSHPRGDECGHEHAADAQPGDADGEPAEAPAELTFGVQGMTCSHCAASVQRVLAEQAGVTSAEVDLAGKRARVRGKSVEAAALRQAVESLGYRTSE